MKIRFIIACIVFNALAIPGYSQNDTLPLPDKKAHEFLKKQIFPICLITAGSLLNAGTIKNEIQDMIPDTHTRIDDILQYGPIGQLYLFDAMGFKHQNTVFNQTKYLLISQLTSGLIVHALKNTTHIKRPVGGFTSFPSGHTTNAFVSATVLYHEFKETDPLLALSGYAFATATACLRLTNDAHWLPDVVAGAGIGILTVNLVYYLKPFTKLKFPGKDKSISLAPGFGPNSFSLTCNF